MGRESAASSTRLIPPVYFLAAIMLMVLLHYLIPLYRWLGWPWQLIGVLPTLSGLLVAVLGERRFKRHGTPVRPFQPSSALVTDGIFRYSRNPMYLGMVLVLAGLAVFLGTATPLAIIAVFIWIITARFIRVEEELLRKQFGDEYFAYEAKVRRWL